MATYLRCVRLICVALLVAAVAFCDSTLHEREVSYEGFQVIRLRSDDPHSLARTVFTMEQIANVDVLSHRRHSAEVMVAPEHVRYVMELSANRKVDSNVVVKDVQRYLEEDFAQRQHRQKRATRDFTNSYRSYDELTSDLQNIINQATVADVNLTTIGHSFENRSVSLVEIRGKPSNGSKRAILIDATIHAREWLAPLMALNIIYKLVVNPDNDPEVMELLEHFDWFIVPVVNPDGYVYTHSPLVQEIPEDELQGNTFIINLDCLTLEKCSVIQPGRRMWRKTRTLKHNTSCPGVDGNRNFGYDWDPDVGGSRDHCSEIYAGPNAFSEPETRNVRDWLRRHKDSALAYITIHSYGQMLMYPYGSSASTFAPNLNFVEDVADVFQTTMKKAGYRYYVGNLPYPTAGCSFDYAKGALNIPVSFTLELSPRTLLEGGFHLPEAKVSKVLQDTWYGFKAMAQRLAHGGGNSNSGASEWSTLAASALALALVVRW